MLGSAAGYATWVIRYPGETSYEYAIKPAPDAMMQEYAMAPDGQLVGQQRDAFTYDPTKRPWYRAAIEANARQYVPAANRGWEKRFPGIFIVKDGYMKTGELRRPGLFTEVPA